MIFLSLSYAIEIMELHLGLALSSSSSYASSCSSRFDNYSKKRKYGNHVPQTLPLLVWNNLCCNKNHRDHDCDGDGDDEVQSNLVLFHYRNVDGVIGRPPVKLCRTKVCHQKIGDVGHSGQAGDGDADDDGGVSRSMYVKVHMEGIRIARKVDLNLHSSYQTLVHTLASMFGKCYEDVKLIYQDKEGDWLVAGDVPWRSFVKTIQRLMLVRKSSWIATSES